jgi:hypothetical protein
MSKYMIIGKPFVGKPEYSGIEYHPDVPGHLIVDSPGGVSGVYHHWSHGLYSGFSETHGIHSFNLPKYVYGEYGNLYDVGDNSNVMMSMETNPNVFVDRSGGLATGKPETKEVTAKYVADMIKAGRAHEIPDTSFWNNRTFVPSGKAPTVENRSEGATPSGISTKRYEQSFIPTHTQIGNKIRTWDDPPYDPRVWAGLDAPVNFSKKSGLPRRENYKPIDADIQLVDESPTVSETVLPKEYSSEINTGSNTSFRSVFKINALLIFIIVLVFSLTIELWTESIQQFISIKLHRGRPLSLKAKFVYAILITILLVLLMWIVGIPVTEITEL